MTTYRECVPDVDDERAGPRPHGAPLAVDEHLEPVDGAVLQQEGERRGVAVRPRAQRPLRLRARRVVVAPHDGAAVGEDVPVAAPSHAQALPDHLQDRQRHLLHRLAVVLVHHPIRVSMVYTYTTHVMCTWYKK